MPSVLTWSTQQTALLGQVSPAWRNVSPIGLPAKQRRRKLEKILPPPRFAYTRYFDRVYLPEGGDLWGSRMDDQTNRPHRKTKRKKNKAHGGKLRISAGE